MDDWRIDIQTYCRLKVGVVDTTTERRKMDNNERLKEIMYTHRIPQWKLADRLSVSENTVQRKLRTPMDDEVYKVYLKAAEDIIQENEQKRIHKTT